MPLIVMCGYPSSGKSGWADKLATYLREEKGKEVLIVREEEHFRGEKNSILDGECAKIKSKSLAESGLGFDECSLMIWF